MLVVQNPLIRNITAGGMVHDLIGFYKYHYPPFLLTYFWGWIFAIWGSNHIVYHFISYFMHALCSCLLFLLLTKVSSRPTLSFFTSLIPALHPLHCEAVNWVCRQNIILVTLLGLIYLYLNFSKKSLLRIIGLFPLLFAVIISPVSLVFLLAEHLLLSPYEQGIRSQLWIKRGLILSAGLMIWGWKITTYPFYNLFANAPTSVLYMMLYLVIPWKIHFLLPPLSPGNPFLISLSFAIICLTCLLYLKTHKKIWGFLFISFITVWVFHGTSNRFNGAWTYLSLVWIAIALCISLKEVRIKPLVPIVTLILLVLIPSFISLTITRNRLWENTGTLLTNALQASPLDRHLLAIYGHYKAAMKDSKAMENSFKKIEYLTPFSLCLKAKADHLLSRYEASSKDYEKLFRVYPSKRRDKYCLFDCAVLKMQQGRNFEAERLFKKIVGVDPYFLYAWHDLGTLLIQEGKGDKGVKMLEKALSIAPSYRPTLDNLAYYFMRKKSFSQASIYLRVALKKVSNSNIQRYYMEWIRTVKSKEFFKYAKLRLVKLTPPG